MGRLFEGETIAEAQDWLAEHFENGGEYCPCCDQFVKLYKRKINDSMAFVLILMLRTREDQMVHVPSFINKHRHLQKKLDVAIRGGDWAKLEYWGLIQKDNITREDGSNRAGWWKITPKGRSFAKGVISVPKHVYIYNKVAIRMDDKERTTIQEATADKFHFSELMNAR
jgi:hypothetical protein